MDDHADNSDDWTPEWVIGLPELGAVAVVNGAKDELIHRVLAFMRETYDHGYSGRTLQVAGIGRVDEWKLNTAEGRERPRLWVVSLDNSLVLFVAGQGERNDVTVQDPAGAGSQGWPSNNWCSAASGFMACLRAVAT
jgi:hypothetical protein